MEGLKVRCRECQKCHLAKVRGEDLEMRGIPLGRVLEWGRFDDDTVRNILAAETEVGFCTEYAEFMVSDELTELKDLEDMECWECC